MLQDIKTVFSGCNRGATTIKCSHIDKLRLETNIMTISNGQLIGQGRDKDYSHIRLDAIQ